MEDMTMATGAGFDVNTDVMNKGAGAVTNDVTAFRKKAADLNQAMEDMFKQWEGRSSKGFSQLHLDWQSNYKQLTQNLQIISDNLGTTSKDYVTADESNTPTRG
jgi:WXG100 family type VII secretion target